MTDLLLTACLVTLLAPFIVYYLAKAATLGFYAARRIHKRWEREHGDEQAAARRP